MQQLFLKIHGDVQGVNFRWDAREKAHELGLVGWVKNVYDGTVEIVAEGEEEALKKFAEWCKMGPRWGRVDKVEEQWGNLTRLNYSTFEIRF